MTQAEYIEVAFKAYFPTSDITVDDAGAETIHVHVVTSTGEPDRFTAVSWVFTAGSDDDRYVFVKATYRGLYPDGNFNPTDIITIPLMPEEVEGPITAHITMDINIDASSPDLNDGTVAVSGLILEYLKGLELDNFQTVLVMPENLLVTFSAVGDFKEIHP